VVLATGASNSNTIKMVVDNILQPAIDHGFWKRGPIYRLQDGMSRYLILEVTDGKKWVTVPMPWSHDDRLDFMTQMFFMSLPTERIKDTVRLLAEIFCNKEQWSLDGPDCHTHPHQWANSKDDFESIDIEAYKEAAAAGGEHEQEVYDILKNPERMSKICWGMIDLLAKTYIAALCEDEAEDEEEEEEEVEQTDPQEMMVCDPDPC